MYYYLKILLFFILHRFFVGFNNNNYHNSNKKNNNCKRDITPIKSNIIQYIKFYQISTVYLDILYYIIFINNK